MALIVGIDFGTSSTVVRYLEEGTNIALPIKDTNGSDIIPSVIYRSNTEEGPLSLYGSEALSAINEACDENAVLIRNFKMDLLAPEGSKERETALANIKDFLENHVLRLLNSQLPETKRNQYDLYVSYPAKWTHAMGNGMIDIYREAGFNARNIIPVTEPVAAAFNMIHNHKDALLTSKLLRPGNPLNVFMLDMGAGTTDICILRLTIDGDGCINVDHVLPYPAVDSPALCGGREIDDALCKYVNQYCCDRGVEFGDDKTFTSLSAKKWKDDHLSSALRNNRISKIPSSLQKILNVLPNGPSVVKSFYMDRTVFEALTHEHWRKLYDTIKSAISLYKQQYKVGAEDIDLLCLTGGHSNWYTVQNLFNGEGVYGSIGQENNENSIRFSKLVDQPYRISSFIDGKPQESVANGLCYRQERTSVEMASANNYWVQLVINDKSSEIVQVVKIGQELPYKYQSTSDSDESRTGLDIDFGVMQPDYNSQLNNDFRGYMKVYSGENLDENKFETIDLSLYIGLFQTLFIYKYHVTAHCEIEIDDANRIKIEGVVEFNPQGMFSGFVNTIPVQFKNYKDE